MSTNVLPSDDDQSPEEGNRPEPEIPTEGVIEEKGFRFTTFDEQLARAEAGVVTEWLFEGVIVRGGSTLLYAPPANGKTLVAMDLALAAALDRPWLNCFRIGRPVKVLYLDDDSNNEREFNSRSLAFRPRDKVPNLFCLMHNNFIITDDVRRRTLIAWCKEKGIELVIIDSLTRIHRQSENNNGEMKLVNGCIKEFCRNGITMVILHHSAKDQKTYRGASEIPTAFDCVYSLVKSAEDLFTLKNQKVRSVGPNGAWEGCDIAVLKDEDGRLLLDGTLPPTGGLQDEEEELRAQVLAQLADGDKHQTALSRALKLSGRRTPELEACLTALVDEGTITPYKVKKATVYHLGGDSEDGEEDAT